jgi:hypothetical protein
MRTKGMPLKPIELVVAQSGQYSIALSFGDGNILHADSMSRYWLRETEKQPLGGAVSLCFVS